MSSSSHASNMTAVLTPLHTHLVRGLDDRQQVAYPTQQHQFLHDLGVGGRCRGTME